MTETRTEKLRKGLLDIEWSLYIETDTPSACLIDEILRVCAKAGLEFVIEDTKIPSLSQQRCIQIDETWFKGYEKIASAYREAQQDMKDWKKTIGVTIQ